METLYINYFVNLKVELLERIKTTSVIKLAVATAEQSTLVNIRSLKAHSKV